MNGVPSGAVDPADRVVPAEFLQHRAPILCLDRVVEHGTEWIVCEQQVIEGPHVDGGQLWEGGLIEGLSQTAGVLNGLHLQQGAERLHRGLLVGLKQLCIHRLPEVGELVSYRIELIRRLDPVTLMQGTASVKGQVVAEGQLKFYAEPAA